MGFTGKLRILWRGSGPDTQQLAQSWIVLKVDSSVAKSKPCNLKPDILHRQRMSADVFGMRVPHSLNEHEGLGFRVQGL